MRAARVFVALLLLAIVWPLHMGDARAAGTPMLVVVAAASPINDIELSMLRRAFEGASTEVAGKRLIPINHPVGTPLRVAFDQQVLGLSPTEVGRFWITKRIRDEGAPPKTVPSPDLAVRVASSLPGAITYTTQNMLSASVKAITIGGKAAGTAGYPLSM